MSEGTVQSLVVVILGAGGATFIWTVVRSYLAVRDSAEGREDKAIARLERFEADCREQLRCEREWGHYWQRTAAIYLYALTVHGVPEPPTPRRPEDPPRND